VSQVPPLRDLHVRLVAKCNLNCRHCYASDWFTRSDQLDSSLVMAAIDQAIELGLQKVTFTGGEPTLHRDLAVLLRHCVDRRLRTKLETNGLLLDHRSGAIRDLLVRHRDLLYLYISYDLAEQRGITAQEHAALREMAVYLHEHGVDVRLQTTLTRVNIGGIEELLELPRRYGIHQRIFLGHSTSGNGAALSPFDFEFVMSTYEYLRSLGLNLELELPPLISGRVQQGCGWGVYRCELMANGDITTCGPTTFTNTGFIAGNLRDTPLRELWERSAYFLAMRDIRQSDFDGVCGRCVFWEECRGSCRSVAWSRGTTWFSPYPLCEMYAQKYPERVAHLLAAEAPVRGDRGRLERGGLIPPQQAFSIVT
jgi:radical SAM protein with 4Fe4S-binding SPASM domain